MRNMSFFYTQDQVKQRTKDVTRRVGWGELRPGVVFRMVVKGQGLKKGEKVQVLGYARCVSNRAEGLEEITLDDVRREGFPGMTPAEFVAMFCRNANAQPDWTVNRIEFEYLEESEALACLTTRPARSPRPRPTPSSSLASR